jgi:hypothetical protein
MTDQLLVTVPREVVEDTIALLLTIDDTLEEREAATETIAALRSCLPAKVRL